MVLKRKGLEDDLSSLPVVFVLLMVFVSLLEQSTDGCVCFVSAWSLQQRGEISRIRRRPLHRYSNVRNAIFRYKPKEKAGTQFYDSYGILTIRMIEDENFLDNNDKKDTDDGPLFFDDFGGDMLLGSSSSSSSISSSLFATQLQQRIRILEEQEAAIQLQIQQNWQKGDWTVRGLSLDPSPEFSDFRFQDKDLEGLSDDDYSDENRVLLNRTSLPYSSQATSAVAPVYIQTCLVVPKREGRLENNNDDDDDDELILWIGRTDGSLVAMKWSDTEPWARFATQRITQQSLPTSSNPDNLPIVMGLVKEILPTKVSNTAITPPTKDPFEIVAQGLQPNLVSPVSLILPLSSHHRKTNNGEDSIVVLTSTLGGNGDIQAWSIRKQQKDPRRRSSEYFLVPSHTWSGAHSKPLILLATITNKKKNSDESGSEWVCSVSQDGTVAVWDAALFFSSASGTSGDAATMGNLIGTWILSEKNSPERISLSSAHLTSEYLYLGTTQGKIWVYPRSDLLALARARKAQQEVESWNPRLVQENLISPINPIQVSKDEAAVTSITTTGSRGDTIYLAAGDARGRVKQWQLFVRGKYVIQTWPKLDTQRLPGKAHLFVPPRQGRSDKENIILEDIDAQPGILDLHYITMNESDILMSVNSDSIVCWSSVTGKPLYSLEGFEQLFSVGIVPAPRAAFVTNGMKNVVCVHDYSQVHGDNQDDDDWDVAEYLDFDSS